VTKGGLDGLLAAKEIVIFCGPGGVGKTSVAAAAAAGAAVRVGGKVLVVTVDPAKRLADALGLAALGNVERRVAAEHFAAAGLVPRGELYGAMLDTKRSWDDLVLRHAPNPEAAYQILENRLYHNLTARFVQSHDYIAMERLHEIHQGGEYDLIVVDTPPSRNAIDFLEAPQRMAEFFGGRLLRWLTMPYRLGGKRGARLVNMAGKPFYQVADRLLGSQFLEDIAEFFLNFQSMYDGFVARAKAVERLLRDRRTTFVVVSTLEGAPLREAEFFMSELAKRRLHLGAVVLNRTLPDAFLDPENERSAHVLAKDPKPAAAAVAAGSPGDEPTYARVLQTIGESYLNFSVVARREAELQAELAVSPEMALRVPYFESDISDLGGLARIADHLFG
jgi:anion-transporting  ArsA/GET3 family ATPase